MDSLFPALVREQGEGCVLELCSSHVVQLADLETLKQSSRLVHYCATPLLFDPAFRQQIQSDQLGKVEGKVSVSKHQWGWALCTGTEELSFPKTGLLWPNS